MSERAVTPEKDPFGYSLLVYLWVTALAAWGGIVNYISKVRNGSTRRFNIAELVGEIVTSGFVGLLVFWVCESMGMPMILSAPLIGISGHFSARTIAMLERVLERQFPGGGR